MRGPAPSRNDSFDSNESRFEIHFVQQLHLPLLIYVTPPYAGRMETQPVEDINAVLGRFQAWTGARNAVEAKPGVRELSDEEALESSRYKWKGVDKRTEKKLHDKAEQADVASTRNSETNRRVAKQAGVKEMAAKTAVVATASKKPAFHEVLAETVRRSEIVLPVKQVAVVKQAAISVRFTPEERELIKARAAEAGGSVSAYVRQCALEVEQLRAEVRDAIAAMECGSAAPVQGSIASRGLFARIARRFFPRTTPSLALQA